MDYTDFSALDFAMDEHFQQWVLTADEEAAHFWNTWQQLHPEKQAEIAEARQLILLHNFKNHPWPEPQQQALKERIARSLEQDAPTVKRAVPRRLPWQRLAVAASVLLALGLGVYFLLLPSATTDYATEFGETRELTLPDGSLVSLNANSQLQFGNTWEDKLHREVWLRGEAFFQVKQLKSGDRGQPIRFTVHVDDMDVEVIGTAFNVNNRSGKVEVTLDEGIVDLKLTDGERMRMQPGEMIAYLPEQKKISKQLVVPEKVTAWREKQIILEDRPLSELAKTIENYYGVEIRFADPALSEKRFNVTLPSDNLEVVLESLELMLNVQSKRNKDEIILK